MGVDDRHHLAAGARELGLHAQGRRELVLVPRKVALAVRVLDVEPQHVKRQVVLLELGVDIRDVLLVLVVPPALMVAQRKERRQRRRARQCGVLPRHRARRLAAEQVRVEAACRGHPVRAHAAGGRATGTANVDEGLRRVEPKQPLRAVFAVRLHEGHAAVDSHLVVELVLEYVEVHQPVRLLAERRRQVVRNRALGDAIHVTGGREVDVDANGRAAEGLRIGEGVEADRVRLLGLRGVGCDRLPERVEGEAAPSIEHGEDLVRSRVQQLDAERLVHQAHLWASVAAQRGAVGRRRADAGRGLLEHAREQRLGRNEALLDGTAQLEHRRVPRPVHVLIPALGLLDGGVDLGQLLERRRGVLVDVHAHRTAGEHGDRRDERQLRTRRVGRFERRRQPDALLCVVVLGHDARRAPRRRVLRQRAVLLAERGVATLAEVVLVDAEE